MEHMEVDYSLAALRRTGSGTALTRLVVRNVEAEIDLTVPRPARPRAAPAKARPKPVLPAVVLPEVRIENLSLRLKLPNYLLVVRRFSLVLDPAAPGLIEVEELDLPGTPLMRKVKGVTRLAPTKITLADTQLWPESVIESLVLELGNLPEDEAAVELAVRHSGARAELSGKSGNWFTGVTADFQLQVSNISQETLAFWGVPSGTATWQAEQAALKVKGPVLRPDLLELDLAVRAGAVSWPGVTLEKIGFAAAARQGNFSLTKLDVTSGSNTAMAHGQARLPAAWRDIGKVPGDLVLDFDAPAVGEWLPPSAEMTGAAAGKIRVGFANANLTEALAEVGADALRVKGVPVESVTSKVRLTNGVVKLEEGRVRLDARNGLEATGELDLRGDQPFAMKWKLSAEDLASVPVEARAGLIWPTAGRVQSEGTAAGSLTQWQVGDWQSLQGQVVLAADGLRVKDAALESLVLRGVAADGKVRLEHGLVKWNEANHVSLTGELDVTDESLPVTAKVVVELPDVTRASAWSRLARGPALRAGAVALDWEGKAGLRPFHIEGQGSTLVKNLKLEGVPEVLGLAAELTQSGSVVQVRDLKASAGPWRVEGSAHYDGWHVEVPALRGFVKNERLIDLSGRLPVRASGIPADSPLSLRIKVDQLDAARLASALGRAFPVKGLLKVEGDFTGTLAAPQGRLMATATQLRPVQQAGPVTAPAEVSLTAIVGDGKLTLTGTATQRPLRPLTIEGGLPLDFPALLGNPGLLASLPLKAEVRLPASPLAFLPDWVPALRGVDGTAAADFSVAGTVGNPVWKGAATVRANGVTFDASSLPTVKDVRLNVRADGRSVTVEEASVMLAGGRLKITGGAGWAEGGDPMLDLRLLADEVLVIRDDNLSLRANAAISCTGPWSAAAVAGQVDFVRGRVFKENECLPLSLPNDLPPPPPPTSVGREGPPALPTPFDRWKFDVAIKTRDPVRLMGNVAKGNAVADLALGGVGARPVLTGKVRFEEMWIKLPFSRLTITKGEILLTKEQPFDPQIDVTGESITGSRIVQVFVQGRALDPKVRLTSSPPLPEGEIASLLATGVTTSDLTSSNDEAAGRAAFVLLKQTYRKLFRKNAEANDDDEPPRLSFEFSVFGSDPARRGISAVYELNPKWRIIGRVGETGTFRGLLHYLIRFR